MNILVLIACSYVVFHSVFCLNKMTKHTDNGIYVFYISFAVAAFCLFIFILTGHNATLAETLFSIGASVKYLFDRRDCQYLINEVKKNGSL